MAASVMAWSGKTLASLPGNPPVRFDERGRETERCRMAQATAPFLDSTSPGPLLLRLDVGGPDYLAPLLGFVGHELAEVGRRTWKSGATEFGEPRLYLGIGKAGVDLA